MHLQGSSYSWQSVGRRIYFKELHGQKHNILDLEVQPQVQSHHCFELTLGYAAELLGHSNLLG